MLGLLARVVAALSIGSSIAACTPPGVPSQTTEASIAKSRSVLTPSPFDDRIAFATSGWKTDFTRRTVSLSEITSGGPPRDGIPPIDRPQFESATDAGGWLRDNEPIVLVEVATEARAYPLQILIWHEIANDTIGEIPIAITFCPLCNTAIAFDRRVDGVGPVRFGTTGNLRHSDLVMWSDDPGETWWQQVTGEAIVGSLAGTRLTAVPAQVIAFADFKAAYPAGKVLSQDTGHARSYGRNPYVGYDDISSSPFLFSGPTDMRLPPMERVVAAELNGEAVAYPFRDLLRVRVVNDTLGGRPIAVLHQGGVASALDAAVIPASRDVGAAGVFERVVNGRALTLRAETDRVVDVETSSTWDISGRATGGPLAGQRMKPLVHDTRFWFVAAVARPDLRLWRAE
jgi:hypothetical protein